MSLSLTSPRPLITSTADTAQNPLQSHGPVVSDLSFCELASRPSIPVYFYAVQLVNTKSLLRRLPIRVTVDRISIVGMFSPQSSLRPIDSASNYAELPQ